MKFKQLLAALFFALALTLGLLWTLTGEAMPVAAAPAQTTRYVDDATGNDTGDCADDNNPCKTIQYAVDQAGADDLIKVAGGTYTDTIARMAPPGYPNPPAGSIITQVVYISKSLTISGGYTAADWNTSDSQANPTTLDAEGEKRVVFVGGDYIVMLENLEIFDGDADGLSGGIDSGAPDTGGGVYAITATVKLSGNHIYSNTAHVCGGVYAITTTVTLSGNDIYNNRAVHGSGVELDWSDGATLSGNYIYSNTALDDGGGVYLYASNDATLSGNHIYSNEAKDGGGVYLVESDRAVLSGNHIYSNTANNDYGGGVYLVESDRAELTGNHIYSNTANDYGGGVCLYDSDYAVLSGNAIYSNTANNNYGGGVYVDDSDYAVLSGNAIYSNTVGDYGYGGGVYLHESGNVTLGGNAIYSNRADIYGGGVYLHKSDDAVLYNNVIASNRAPEGSGVYVRSTADLHHNTIVRNGSTGLTVGSGGDVTMTNNILVSHTVGISVATGCTARLDYTLWATSTAWANDTNWVNNGTLNHDHGFPGHPRFVDPDNGDYHIGPDSAAVDKGPDVGVSQDKDGLSRPQGAAFDLGAYEVPSAPIGGHTEFARPLVLLWPVLLLAALVATGAIAGLALRRHMA